MDSAWQFMLLRLAGALLAALLIGFLYGHAALWVIAVLAGYLTVQLANLYRLQRWLLHRREEQPPDMRGTWGEVITLIGRIYRRKNFHKRRVRMLFREFRRLTSLVPDGILLLTPEHDIMWFNPAAAQLLGLRRKVDFGVRIENLVRQPVFVRYASSASPSGVVVVRYGPVGDRFLVCQLIPAGDQVLMLVRDVTRETRLEEMRRDFVANASHELRSPLTVISGYLDQLVEDPNLDQLWKGPVQEMRRQAERMRLIVHDLLELSKLESSSGEAPFEKVDMGGMLALIRKDVLAQEQRPHEITLKLDSSACLLGSESELHSIAANLISNAVKYTPPEGSVAIRWWTDGAGAHLAVRDTGIGISPEHLPRLTERFYRVDRGRSRKSGGSGLGLAIVKHALQRHGGRMEIESVEGRGSTFTCHFPLKRVTAWQGGAASSG